MRRKCNLSIRITPRHMHNVHYLQNNKQINKIQYYATETHNLDMAYASCCFFMPASNKR